MRARSPPRRAARLGSLPVAQDFASRPGVGVAGRVDGHDVESGAGRRASRSSWDGELRATLVVADTARSRRAAEAVAELRALGLTPVLLTGDRTRDRRAIAAEVGIENVVAEVFPDDKAAEVRRLQAEGEVVAMVGDGVNDAPALAQADLGIAIGTGTDVAIEASDLTLVSGDLRAAADAIRLSRRVLGTIKGNLFWAFAYNVAADAAADAGPAQPDGRRGRDGRLEPLRRLQLPAAPPLPQPTRDRLAAPTGGCRPW